MLTIARADGNSGRSIGRGPGEPRHRQFRFFPLKTAGRPAAAAAALVAAATTITIQ